MSIIEYESKFKADFSMDYATEGSAAIDLRAYFSDKKPITLYSGDSVKISLGISIDMSSLGSEVVGLIFPRSGLGSLGIGRVDGSSLGGGIVITNNVGVIDSDYRGELFAPMVNRGAEPYTLKHGERILQMITMPILRPKFIKVDKIDKDTYRGINGFGSTSQPENPNFQPENPNFQE